MKHAYDIETEAWDKFVIGGVLSSNGTWYCRDWTKERELVEYILSLEGELWGHNAGRYDTLWLLKWIKALMPGRYKEVRIFATSARITLVKIGKLSIRDSAALAPMALAKAAGIGGMVKLDTGFECGGDCHDARRTGKKCGGYCRISRSMSGTELTTLEMYLKGDCIAVLDGCIGGLETYAARKGIKLAGTIGSCSWQTAQKQYDLPNADWKSPRHYAWARKGYFGGRVQVGRPVSKKGKRWDINSAYIAALTETNLPVGDYYETTSEQARDSYHRGKEGIYTVTVAVDKQHIPPLPWRDGKQRVWYPYGTFTGSWSGLALRYATAHCHTRIVDFFPSLVWSDSAPILRAYAQSVWDARKEAIQLGGKKSPLATWEKWRGNAITGKFAQNPVTFDCRLMLESPAGCIGSHDCRDKHPAAKCCPHECKGNCGASWQPIGRNTGVWSRPVFKIATNAHVQWAAYLTGAAGIKLHSQIVSDGVGGLTFVYGDTDSMYAERDDAINVGEGLGQFLYEGSYTDFRALAPKTYSFVNDKGEREVKSKGIPNPDWGELIAGIPQRIQSGVNQFRSGVRSGNLFQRRDTFRAAAVDKFGDREYTGKFPWTEPTHFDDIGRIQR